jgi:hypothetical protein
LRVTSPRVIPAPTRRALAAARAAEDAIRLNAHETVLAFDWTGRKVVEKVGSEDTVELTARDVRRMRHAVVTHNHPGGVADGPAGLRGTSFSEADVELAAFAQVAEERVVTAGWRYSLRPPAAGWSYDWWQTTLQPALREARHDATAALRTDIRRGELTRDEATALLMHELWTRVARRLGMRYTRTQVT